MYYNPDRKLPSADFLLCLSTLAHNACQQSSYSFHACVCVWERERGREGERERVSVSLCVWRRVGVGGGGGTNSLSGPPTTLGDMVKKLISKQAIVRVVNYFNWFHVEQQTKTQNAKIKMYTNSPNICSSLLHQYVVTNTRNYPNTTRYSKEFRPSFSLPSRRHLTTERARKRLRKDQSMGRGCGILNKLKTSNFSSISSAWRRLSYRQSETEPTWNGQRSWW